MQHGLMSRTPSGSHVHLSTDKLVALSVDRKLAEFLKTQPGNCLGAHERIIPAGRRRSKLPSREGPPYRGRYACDEENCPVSWRGAQSCIPQGTATFISAPNLPGGRVGLVDAEDVPLGVHTIGLVAHAGDGHLREGHLAAFFDDFLDKLIDGRDADQLRYGNN